MICCEKSAVIDFTTVIGLNDDRDRSWEERALGVLGVRQQEVERFAWRSVDWIHPSTHPSSDLQGSRGDSILLRKKIRERPFQLSPDRFPWHTNSHMDARKINAGHFHSAKRRSAVPLRLAPPLCLTSRVWKAPGSFVSQMRAKMNDTELIATRDKFTSRPRDASRLPTFDGSIFVQALNRLLLLSGSLQTAFWLSANLSF